MERRNKILLTRSCPHLYLSDETIQHNSDRCRSLQLVLPALAILAVIYLGVVFLNLEGKTGLNQNPYPGPLFIAGCVFFVATVVGPLFLRKLLSSVPLSNLQDKLALNAGDKIFYMLLLSCGLLAAGAFINIFAFSATQDAVHLVVACFLLVGIITRIPTQPGFKRTIQHFIEYE